MTEPLSWDTFRTFYPLLCLTSPVEFTQIVDNYVDGGCKNGWIPEWHANYLPSWIQGDRSCFTPLPQHMLKPHNRLSLSADNSVSRFAMAYRNEAAALGIDLTDLYATMKADGEDNPLE